jgi:uncharacterized protein
MILSREEARNYLVGHHGLRAPLGKGLAGVHTTLKRLRCIQLDPLDRIGTNADLVVLARVDGAKRGDVHRLQPGKAFEHFAKERCLLPADAFPYYRDQAAETPWWRSTERMKRLPAGIIERVLAEVEAKGPLTPDGLGDHGAVVPIDWSGWKGTAKAATMALEVLWTRCQVVTAGRTARTRLYDVPRRALPKVHADEVTTSFAEWALLERVEAAGLLSVNAGAHWSMLSHVRTSTLPEKLVKRGKIVEVTVEGSARRYYAPKGFLDRAWPDDDGRMRILGPLDPLIWDRKLVQDVWGFDYVWEVYKPAHQRKWGWYVVPLLHEGRLVGRMDARVEGGEVVVEKRWVEDGVKLDEAAFRAMLERHAAAL